MTDQSRGWTRTDAWALTDAITRLRRTLRVSIRSDHPWETLPMAQIEILQRLNEHSRIRVRDLAAYQRLAANTVSTLIQQMTAAGLIEREPDPSDGRAVMVSISAQGERALASWLAGNERRLEEALGTLSARDRRIVVEAVPALTRLVVALDEQQRAAQDDDGVEPTA